MKTAPEMTEATKTNVITYVLDGKTDAAVDYVRKAMSVDTETAIDIVDSVKIDAVKTPAIFPAE